MPISRQMKALYIFVALTNISLVILGLKEENIDLAISNIGFGLMTLNAYMLQKRADK